MTEQPTGRFVIPAEKLAISCWENSAYNEHYSNVSEKFKRETQEYLKFMEDRHKVFTLDYIADIEYKLKMQQSRIDHLERLVKQNIKKEDWSVVWGVF